MVLVCVNLSQGPWYENTSSNLFTISPSGWVQLKVMDVGSWETAMVTVGVDGAETRRVFKISYASTTNYGGMDGGMDGGMEGRMDGRMDGWRNGWRDGWRD